MDNIKVPVSPGEVLDKITILEIKSERMTDPEKVANVQVELGLLQETWNETIRDTEEIQKLHSQLKEINEALWEIEDDIRDKERAKEFDEHFIELARSIYVTNDRRSEVKKRLNLHLGSEIVEEKSYKDYG
jgi:prefoldin subunit 5